MWTVLAITVGVFLLAVVGMAVGVIVSGKRLKGSCGGAVGPNGTMIGDCLCARQGKKECESGPPEVVASGNTQSVSS